MNYLYFIFYFPFFLYIFFTYLVNKALHRKKFGKKEQELMELLSVYIKKQKIKNKISLVFWILLVYLLLK